jgi:nitroreductase
MDLDAAIRGRRSIRKYQQREVPQELLQEVLETGLWAPSGMNKQEWDVIVLRGDPRDHLVEIISRSQEYILPHLQEIFSEKMINISLQVFRNLGGAPVVILVYVPKETVSYGEGLDERGRYHAEFNRFNRLQSVSALIQNILLKAHAKGLGTCWMTGPKYMEEEIGEFLGMTDKELVAIIPIGYPDQAPPAPPRKAEAVRWVGF